jgi:Na+/H+-translocating membrane pyrophosphatase
LSRISYAASSSLFAAHITAKNISNFVAYFVPGLTTLVFFLIFLLSQDKSPEEMLLEDIKKVGKALMAFTFGISTGAIGTKINSVIYGKASEGALPMMNQMEPKLPRNHANPVIVCKSVGENVRKVVSNALDYNMYLCVSLVCAVVAATSVIGADQQGEIIFDHSVSNCYLPLLAFCFLLFFSVVASAVSLMIFSPDSGEEAALIFKRETYIVVFFLIGFLALAAYLCLPVEFFL